MAVVKFAAEIVEAALFGYADNPVRIIGGRFDPVAGVFEFEIEGDDVPSVGGVKILAITMETRNRAGDRLRRMIFEPAR